MSSDAEPSFDLTSVSVQALTPEQRLYVAVMRRAVWDYVLYKGSRSFEKRVLSDEAKAWLFYPDEDEDMDDDGRMTFVYVCEILGLDPDHVRIGTIRLKRADIQRLSSNIKEG